METVRSTRCRSIQGRRGTGPGRASSARATINGILATPIPFLIGMAIVLVTPILSQEAGPVNVAPRPLTLREAIEKGASSNAALRVQENEAEKATLDVRIAHSYELPEVSLFSGVTLLSPRPGIRKEILPGLPPLELNMGRNTNLSHGAQIRYILYEGGRRSHIKEAATHASEAARWMLADRRRIVEYDIRQAYLGVLLSKEILTLAEENSERSVVRSRDASTAYNAGAAPRLEWLRAQAEEAEAAVAVDEAKDRIRTARRQMMVLIGGSEEEVDVVGSLDGAATKVASFDAATLHGREPEFARLMAADYQRRAAEAAAEARKGEKLPTVVAGLKLAETQPYLGENRYGPDMNAFFQISYPLFDSGRVSASYEKARLDVRSATLQEEEIRRSLTSYFALLTDRIDSLKRGLAARRVGIERATVSRDAAQVAWKNGSIDLSRLLDAEVLLARARVDYYRATADLLGALADWERWSGISTGVFEVFQ